MHTCMSMTIADIYALLLVGVASAFGVAGHVQQSVSSVRMAKYMLKEFEEVSEVSNTSPNARIQLFLKTATSFPSRCSSLSYSHTHRSRHVLQVRQSPNLPHSHHSFFFPF